MNTRERLEAQAATLGEEEQESLYEALIEQETLISLHGFLLLLRAAIDDGTSPWEPIWAFPADPLSRVLSLPSYPLRELAEQSRLQEIGLLEMATRPEEGSWLALTPQGAAAVLWWWGTLEAELGFEHPELRRPDSPPTSASPSAPAT